MKIKCLDKRPMLYKINGREYVTPINDILEVSEKTGERLLKLKNGKTSVFEKIVEKKKREDSSIKTEEKLWQSETQENTAGIVMSE